MADLSPQDFEQTIIKLLNLGTDSIEKLAPYADKLADLFIIYGLYTTGKEAGINPFWGPLSYKLATTPEETPAQISVGFGWGATQVKLPASVRMVGVLGLASMGLAVSLSQLSEGVEKGTGQGPPIPVEAYTPPAIAESEFEEIISQNTATSYVYVDGREEIRYTIDWAKIKTSFKTLPKIGLFNPNVRLMRFRTFRGLHAPASYTDISASRYMEILNALSEDLSQAYEGQRKWMQIITGNAVANIYPGVKFEEKAPDIKSGVYG